MHASDASRTVLHVSQPPDGGVGRCVAALVADQLERGWRVAVATPPEGELAEIVAELGAEQFPWRAERSPGAGIVAETRRLRRIVSAVRPDVVHLHSSKAGLAGRLALRRRLPTVFQPHGWSFEAVDGPVEWMVVRWERLGARWAHAIVCVSQAERERALARGIRGPFRVIPNGADLTRFAEAGEEERGAARLRLGLDGGPLVVCVGLLRYAKGQDVLLAAWPAVRERVPTAELVLVGDGDEEEKLRLQAGPGVTLAGVRNDVADWLAAADVVAVPSRWEGMSLGMLEAMARGRSIVATDVPGAREAMGDSAGAIVPVEDPPALAAAIAERLLDPAKAAAEGRAAAEGARREHDLRDTVQRTAELYGELIGRPLGVGQAASAV